jgi:preprotein translocase subunit SecE
MFSWRGHRCVRQISLFTFDYSLFTLKKGPNVKFLEWIKRLPSFLRDVRLEVKKTSFPSRPEVINTTMTVVVVVIIFGVYLWIVDQLIFSALNSLFKVFQ